MSNGGPRTRSERVAALELPPGRLGAGLGGPVPARHAVADGAGLRRGRGGMRDHSGMGPADCTGGRGWCPRASCRRGCDFKEENRNETAQKRLKAREETKAVFVQDIKPLEQLRAESAKHDRRTYQDRQALTEKTRFDVEGIPAAAGKRQRRRPSPRGGSAAFQEFRKALAGKENLDQLDRAVAEAFARLEQHGLLANPPENSKITTRRRSWSAPADNPAQRREVEVSDVTVDPKAIRRNAGRRARAPRRSPTASTPGSSRGFCIPRKP